MARTALTTALMLAAISAAGCGEPTAEGTDTLPPRALDVSLAITPDSATGWVLDTLHFQAVRSGADRDSLSLTSILWSVVDSSIARIVRAVDSVVDVVILKGGTTTVQAKIDTFTAGGVAVVLEEGELLAAYTWTPRAWLQSPAISDDGSIFLLRRYPSAALVAVNPDLTPRWEQGIASGAFLNPALGADGTIYVSSFRFTGGFSPNGAMVWQDTTSGSGETAPAVDGFGSVFAAGKPFGGTLADWAVVRYDPPGIPVVRIPAFNNTIKLPLTIVADSVIVVGDLGDRAFGISRSGGVVWVDTLPSKPRFFAPSVGADRRTIYFPARSHVVAIDGLTGTQRWVWDALAPAGHVPLAPIVDADGAVYVQTQWTVVALNPDGTVRWQADSLGGLHWINGGGAPALAAGGVLYVACGTDLCAVRTTDGSVRWRRPLPFPGIAGAIMITPDSSIVFVTIGAGFPGVSFDSSRVVKLRGRFPLANAPWPVDGGNLRRSRRGVTP